MPLRKHYVARYTVIMITTVDIGGTKTLVAQFGDGGKPVNESRFTTPHDPHEFIQALSEELNKFAEVKALSVGIPGRVNPDNTVTCRNLAWNNVPLRKMLETTYRVPVYIENDANLAGLAEINSLSPVPKLGIYLTISTGIGGGVITNGKIWETPRHGELGHMLFWFEDKWQDWESFASGKVLHEHFGKLAKDLTEPDEWEWVAERLSIGLCALIPAFRPDVIVLGGGVGNYFPSYKDLLIQKITRRLPPRAYIPQIREATHPEEAVIYGAYHYAVNQQS